MTSVSKGQLFFLMIYLGGKWNFPNQDRTLFPPGVETVLTTKPSGKSKAQIFLITSVFYWKTCSEEEKWWKNLYIPRWSKTGVNLKNQIALYFMKKSSPLVPPCPDSCFACWVNSFNCLCWHCPLHFLKNKSLYYYFFFLRFFFDMDLFFKSFFNLLLYCFCLYLRLSAMRHVGS